MRGNKVSVLRCLRGFAYFACLVLLGRVLLGAPITKAPANRTPKPAADAGSSAASSALKESDSVLGALVPGEPSPAVAGKPDPFDAFLASSPTAAAALLGQVQEGPVVEQVSADALALSNGVNPKVLPVINPPKLPALPKVPEAPTVLLFLCGVTGLAFYWKTKKLKWAGQTA